MEEIGEMIGKGFDVWRSNLNLCIPFLLSIFVSLLILASFLAAFSLVFLPNEGMIDTMLQNLENIQEPAQMQGSLGNLEMGTILLIAALFFVLVLLLSLVDAFFTAGAIGMARQAMEKGKSDTSVMWAAGKRHLFKMFLATLLTGLFILAGLIFLLPALAQGFQLQQVDLQTTGLMAAGLLMFILYVLALSVILVAVPYALVVDGLGIRRRHNQRARDGFC